MGNKSSSEVGFDTDYQDGHNDEIDSSNTFYGFRVLGIQEQSPASTVGFVSFFDFIIEANGIRLDTKDATLMELIAQSEDLPMHLVVYNLKTQKKRQVQLIPSREWPGKGLLGVTIRFDSYENAQDQLLHVVDVVSKSPAAQAGLQAESDFLLGTPEHVFRNVNDLSTVLHEHLENTFNCYVYNAEEDLVRLVRISPSEKWEGSGKSGILGAEVAQGVLHRLPSACRNTIGSSSGFLKLTNDVVAATDPFMRKRPAASEQHSKPSINQHNTEQVEMGDPLSSPTKTPVNPHSQGLSIRQELIQQTGSHNSHSSESERKAASAPDAQEQRFSPQMDLPNRFPMSTVEVVADASTLRN